jgi:type IV secretion system protein VirB6
MSGACPAMVGEGVVRGVLAAVDCQTRDFSQGGYLALTGQGSPFQTALTALLTIYVALVGYRMLFASGGARISDLLGIALRIGVVLALVTSWATFQTLVFDLAARAPTQLASIVAGPLQAQGSEFARDPVSGLQAAYDQLGLSALAFGRIAGPVAKAFSSPEAAAAEALSTAAGALFMASVGLIAVATIAVGVLTAIGPVFIALFLIPATRGLFVGWVRALAAAALIPLGAWILNLLMLVMLEPWIVALAEQRRTLLLNAQTAMSASAVVFVFAAAQVALLAAALVIAFSFRLSRPARTTAAAGPGGASAEARARASATPQDFASRPQRLAFDLQRDHAALVMGRPQRLAAVGGFAMPSGRGLPADAAPPRLGDVYRRPAVRGRAAQPKARSA